MFIDKVKRTLHPETVRDRKIGQQLIPYEKIDDMMERSPVPLVLAIVAILVTASTLLFLADRKTGFFRNQLPGVGEVCQEPVPAEIDFTCNFVDKEKQKDKIDAEFAEARKNLPIYRKYDEGRKKKLLAGIMSIYDGTAEGSGELAKKIRSRISRNDFEDRVSEILQQGIYDREADTRVGSFYYIDQQQRRYEKAINEEVLLSPGSAASRLSRNIITSQDSSTDNDLFLNLVSWKLTGGNVVLDKKRIEEEENKLKNAIKRKHSATSTKFKKGDVILAKGEKIRKFHKQVYDEMVSKMPLSSAWQLILGVFIVLGIMALTAGGLIISSGPGEMDNRSICIMAFTLIVGWLINYGIFILIKHCSFAWLQEGIAMPLGLTAIGVTISCNVKRGLFATVISAAIFSMVVCPGHAMPAALVMIALGGMLVFAVRKTEDYQAFILRSFWTASLGSFLLGLFFRFFESEKSGYLGINVSDFSSFLVNTAKSALISGFATAVFAFILVCIYEKVFFIATNMLLSTLLNDKLKLLEELNKHAPGSNAHCMTVAKMSKFAADTIGADKLLAEVGGLYHDIGKIINSSYFTENGVAYARKLHSELSPTNSVRLLRQHVQDGVDIARKYRICRKIRRIIECHHGNSFVGNFYQKILQESEALHQPVAVQEEQFRYGGRLPETKEETIVSLADACEAASRSLEDKSRENVAALVDKIITGRYAAGELRNSRLSLQEVKKIQDAFVEHLSSNDHRRVSYDLPEPKEASGSVQ